LVNEGTAANDTWKKIPGRHGGVSNASRPKPSQGVYIYFESNSYIKFRFPPRCKCHYAQWASGDSMPKSV